MESEEKSEKNRLTLNTKSLSIRSDAPSPVTPIRGRHNKKLSTVQERNDSSQRIELNDSSDEGRYTLVDRLIGITYDAFLFI